MGETSSARILIIDDNLPNAQLVGAQLELAGYDVSVAESGVSGLCKALEDRPDLILLDVMMPDMDGFEVARRLRSEPITQALPVIMLTALGDRSDRLRGLDAGADDFLAKPVDRAELLARVRSALRIKRLYDELQLSRDEIRAQAAQLALEKAQAESILASMSEGVAVTDRDGRVVYLNAAAQALGGVELAQAAGTQWRDALGIRGRSGNQLEEAECPIHAALQLGTAVDGRELTVWRADGTDASISVTAAPVRDLNDVVTGAVAVMRDMTSQREVQRMRDQFVAMVSHELRTPLAVIYGFAELLLFKEQLETRARGFVEPIYREAERLSNLVNDLLDLQRLDSGRLVYHPRPVSLRDAVWEAEQALAPRLARHELTTEVEPPDLAARVDGDRLSQVLVNLLSNAIKYSPGGQRISLRATADGDYARVSISDQGLGIPAEAMPHLFERFYRVEGEDRSSIRGTGLGLNICRQIVEDMGGKIWVESPGPGLGATFTFTLKLAHEALASPRASLVGPTTPRILLVKDDPDLATIILEHLGLAGFTVEAVTTGEEALARVRVQRPSAVVLDIELAGRLDGWAVLAALREDPRSADVPVIIVSGREERARGLAIGADDFLVKPVPANRLIAAVRRLVGADPRGPVLVVDDDASAREMVNAVLTRAGLPVLNAGSGSEALACMQELAPAAIVLDLVMPEMDGFQVLEHLSQNPRWRDIPVLILTGTDLSASDRARLSQRAADILRKDGSVARNLTSAIARALESR